jgi:hypothetical protein
VITSTTIIEKKDYGVVLMYGHQFYRVNFSGRLECLNSQLHSERFESLEDLLSEMYLDIEAVLNEFIEQGYLFSKKDNRFMKLQEA